jgi:hypothetical protein
MIHLKLNIPISFLLLNNIVPVVGLFFYGWRIFDVLFFFWIEIVIIGFFNIIKILSSRKDEKLPFRYNQVGNHLLTSQLQVKVASVLIFVAWYGMYLGFFLLILNKVSGRFFDSSLLVFALSPLISHSISFFLNYILKKEFINTSPWEQIFKPFWRTIPIVTILALFSIFGQFVTLLVFLFIKTVGDYHVHTNEHTKVVL